VDFALYWLRGAFLLFAINYWTNKRPHLNALLKVRAVLCTVFTLQIWSTYIWVCKLYPSTYIETAKYTRTLRNNTNRTFYELCWKKTGQKTNKIEERTPKCWLINELDNLKAEEKRAQHKNLVQVIYYMEYSKSWITKTNVLVQSLFHIALRIDVITIRII